MKRLMSIALLLCVIFSTVYMQGRTVQKLPVKLEHKKATLKDTIIKENPIDGTFEMIVTNEDGTTSRYIKSPEDIARVLLNASSEDSIITYIPEDDEWLLTVDKEDAQNKNSKKDTTFEDNGNGTYTMTYTLHNKEKIKSVVPAKTMLAFLNRSAAPHSKWSLGENNGLVLNTNIKKWRKEKSSNFEQILDMKYLNIEPMHDVGDGTFSIIDNNKGSIEIVNEQKSTPIKLSKEAQFSGGNDKLSHYIISQIQYPQEAKNEGMEAQIYIEFKVNEDGTVSNLRTRALETTIKRKSTPPKDEYLKKLLEKEALRVIKNMPKWEPAYQENGEAISMKYVLPVKFQLKQQ